MNKTVKMEVLNDVIIHVVDELQNAIDIIEVLGIDDGPMLDNVIGGVASLTLLRDTMVDAGLIESDDEFNAKIRINGTLINLKGEKV